MPEIDVDETTTERTDSEFLLHTGEPLTLSDLYPIAAAEKSCYVVLMGGIACGKTTLIASLYQMLLREVRVDYMFAGSQTLIGFEKRCKSTRLADGRTSPYIPHTPRGVEEVLHLRLFDCKTLQHVNLFMSDISGEDFTDVLGRPDEARREFYYVRAAKTIALMIDGAKLCSPQYMAEIHRAVSLLQTFREGGLIANRAKILLVISKFDLVNGKSEVRPSLALRKFQEQFSDWRNRFCLVETAAMPEHGSNIQVYHGLKHLYREMLSESVSAVLCNCFPTESKFELWGRRNLYMHTGN